MYDYSLSKLEFFFQYRWFSFSTSTYPISPIKSPNYYDYVPILVVLLTLLEEAEYKEIEI